MRPSTSRIFQTPFAVDPNDFIITHEQFTWSNTYSGSLYHYYQDFVLSSQFDLTTTLIQPEMWGEAESGTANSVSWEIIDDAGGTILRAWMRYNNKAEADDLIVRITQGLSYVDYIEIDETLATSISSESVTVSAVPDWNDGMVNIEPLISGQSAYKGKTGSGTSAQGLWEFKLTSATALGFKAIAAAASNCTFQAVIYRY